MQALNIAFEACVAHLTKRRPLPPAAGNGPPPAGNGPPPTGNAPAGGRIWGRPGRFVDQDSPSFTVDALPAETFEAMLVALSWIGELVDDDPPYRLECLLNEPEPCWCRLDVVPDAGGSTVSITVVSVADGHRVSAEAVRDTWVDHLNRIGRPTP